MADTTINQPDNAAPAAASGLAGDFNQVARNIGQSLTKTDVMFALGMVTIVVILILPMPSWLLDVALAMSITLSVLILMVSLFIQHPLEFTSFPTVLLVSALLRLALNLASTRLILGHGHEGTGAAGAVIQSFGALLMQGNYVIGIIVFVILLIVNFVVITKGSGRIAEVAARFSLDGMPGKQMAIDADLSAGLIDELKAKERRKRLEDESNFFGSMDGASKFVRGDAVAGLLITGINLVGGLIIGVAFHGLDVGTAATRYLVLTVGDGLVSQIPALIVSLGAGLLVTKAGVEGSTDKALAAQLGAYPQALALASFLAFAMSALPGIPIIQFWAIGGLTGYFSYRVWKLREEAEVADTARALAEIPEVKQVDEPIQTALAMDFLRLELGYGLLSLINDAQGYRLTDQIKALRRQLASELGFVMPSVRILDNMSLGPNTYVLRVKEVESGRGDLRMGHLLVMDPRGDPVALPGEPTTEPTFGLPATWVDQSLREEASFRGYTVVDPATVITTHLTEIIKDNLPDLLSYSDTQKLLNELPSEHQKIVADVIPGNVSLATFQRILQTLLGERISIRDLPSILEGASEASGFTRNIAMMTEHVRTRLARQICAGNLAPGGYLPLITLSPEWEQAFTEALIGTGDEKQLALSPAHLQEFIQTVRVRFQQAAGEGEVPVLLCSPGNRPYVRSIIERFRPQTFVMSQNEIHPQVRLKTIGQI
jgi:flagellar biosynthesis protein FlhA